MLSIVFVALFALCSLELSHAQDRVNSNINIGATSGVDQHDIVQNGVWYMAGTNRWKRDLGHNEYPMSNTPDHKIYISLRQSATESVNVRIVWKAPGLGSNATGYVAGTRVSWNDVEWWDTLTLQPGQQHWIEFFQPTGDAQADNMAPHVTKTGCTTPRDDDLDEVYFDIWVDDDFMRFNMTKQCSYPRLAFGTSSANRLTIKDILSPNNNGNSPKLHSSPFNLTITPNKPTRQIVMSAETGGGWSSMEETVYSIKRGPHTDDLYIDTPVESGTVKVAYVDVPDPAKIIPLTFRSVCSPAAIDQRMSQHLTMEVYAGFSTPYVLDIFDVTCGVPTGTDGDWPGLAIQPAPSEQLVGWEGTYVYTDNAVVPLWQPDGVLVKLGRQQHAMTFHLTYPPDRTFTGNIQVSVVSGGSLGAVSGSINRVYNKQTNQVIDRTGNTTFTFPSGELLMSMDSMCSREGTMVVDVLLTDLKASGTLSYRPIEFRFSWECTVPKFTLSTDDSVALVTNGKGTAGTYGIREVTVATAPSGINVTTITTQLSSGKLTDVIYLSIPQETVSNYKYYFSWTFAPTDTNNIKDAVVDLNGYEISDAAGAKAFEVSFFVSSPTQNSIELRVNRFTCTKKGQVRLVTWLRYDFLARVDLVWVRDCTDVPDQWNDDDSSSMSGGAIFGIVVAVLIAVGCLGGIAYNSIKLGKTGLSVIPGVDAFNAWNDGVQGPKRYSSDISKSSKSKVADVEIHSLGYGSYQQSDDGYVDEIDTL